MVSNGVIGMPHPDTLGEIRGGKVGFKRGEGTDGFGPVPNPLPSPDAVEPCHGCEEEHEEQRKEAAARQRGGPARRYSLHRRGHAR